MSLPLKAPAHLQMFETLVCFMTWDCSSHFNPERNFWRRISKTDFFYPLSFIYFIAIHATCRHLYDLFLHDMYERGTITFIYFWK